MPYIVTWQDLMEDPPIWLNPFVSSGLRNKTVLTLQKGKCQEDGKSSAPYSQESTEDTLLISPLP